MKSFSLACLVACVAAQDGAEASGNKYCLKQNDCGADEYCANFFGLFPRLIKQPVWDCHGETNCVNEDGSFNEGGACCYDDGDCSGASYCMNYQDSPQIRAYKCKKKCFNKLCEEALLKEADTRLEELTVDDQALATQHVEEEIDTNYGKKQYCHRQSDCGRGQYCRNFFHILPRFLSEPVWDCHGQNNCVDEDGDLNSLRSCCQNDLDCDGESYCMNYQTPQTRAYVCVDKCRGQICEEDLLAAVNEDMTKLTLLKEQLAEEEEEGHRHRTICQTNYDCSRGYYCDNKKTARAFPVWDCHGTKKLGSDCVDGQGYLKANGQCCVNDRQCDEDSYCMIYNEPETEVYMCRKTCKEGEDLC